MRTANPCGTECCHYKPSSSLLLPPLHLHLLSKCVFPLYRCGGAPSCCSHIQAHVAGDASWKFILPSIFVLRTR